jgi:hypothetical protein
MTTLPYTLTFVDADRTRHVVTGTQWEPSALSDIDRAVLGALLSAVQDRLWRTSPVFEAEATAKAKALLERARSEYADVAASRAAVAAYAVPDCEEEGR